MALLLTAPSYSLITSCLVLNGITAHGFALASFIKPLEIFSEELYQVLRLQYCDLYWFCWCWL